MRLRFAPAPAAGGQRRGRGRVEQLATPVIPSGARNPGAPTTRTNRGTSYACHSERSSRALVPSACSERLSRALVPSACPERLFRALVPSACPERLSRAPVPSACPERLSRAARGRARESAGERGRARTPCDRNKRPRIQIGTDRSTSLQSAQRTRSTFASTARRFQGRSRRRTRWPARASRAAMSNESSTTQA